ncbi:GDP-L-fucose synthase [Niveibacterium sp. SC-1]|uniref:GDP-L-fucose synthase family protein n=1 Tax=Niveibacterium sp. SC-1 TaxID=3135646 RepID=UPI00311FB3E5
MDKSALIYVAGHRGLVGSAIVRALKADGYTNIITRSHDELDLTDAAATQAFFSAEVPQYVFLAAAKVGGIVANNTYPADFIRQNTAIQLNVIDSAWRAGAKRLLFLGSSCIYPKAAPQPMKEDYLLTGPLEATNRAYALAKIAGIEMCWSYNRQFGTRYLAAMPTNLYGPNDNYHATNSHVIPGLIRRFHEAAKDGTPRVSVWGSGKPRREFLFSTDMAEACIKLMTSDDAVFDRLLQTERSKTDFIPPLVNIGSGVDLTIQELAEAIKATIGYKGEIVFDPSLPDGTPRKLMDISKIAEFGWRPKVGLTEGLKLAYADYLSTLDVSSSG